MTQPMNKEHVRDFIGFLNYSRDMWSKRSHLIHTLTSITSNKVKFKRTDMENKLFDEKKRIVSCNTLPLYPDFNIFFDIHTNASYFQL